VVFKDSIMTVIAIFWAVLLPQQWLGYRLRRAVAQAVTDRSDYRSVVRAALDRLFALPGGRGWAAGSDPPPHWLVGTPSELAERLHAYAEVIDGVYLQHLLHDELEPVELIGRELAPALAL